MLGFDAISALPLADAGSAASYTASAAATLDLVASVSASHGVAGAIAATLDLSAAATGEYVAVDRMATVAATLDLVASVSASHGVAASAAATLSIDGQAGAGHGVAGTAAASLPLTAAATGAHGVSATIGATLDLVPAIAAVHERYELRGEVRVSGVLVNRRVRIYLRSTGALVNQADTTAGRFGIHTGFAPLEHYLAPIDLADTATDWSPPTANRVLSVLAQD